MLLAMKTLNQYWCVSIRMLSQLNSRLFLVKLSVLQSFSGSYFCLISSISRLYGAGNCWLRFSGVCSHSFIHSFIHFIFPSTRNATTVYRNTLKIIYNIPTKLFTRLNVVKARKAI